MVRGKENEFQKWVCVGNVTAENLEMGKCDIYKLYIYIYVYIYITNYLEKINLNEKHK